MPVQTRGWSTGAPSAEQAREDNLPPALMTSEHGPFALALAKIRRFAVTEEPIVLLGETGTGKSHLAYWAHAQSRRATGPFFKVDLARTDDGLAGSDLFGHMMGSFTGATGTRPGAIVSANHGTLFFDEVGKASPAVQHKLLELLETGRFRPVGCDRDVKLDARLMFATNEPLAELVASGRMLHDFLPRLGYLRVEVPPLRDRKADIPRLLRFFVHQLAPNFGWSPATPPGVDEALEFALVNWTWPDNVRGLMKLVRRLLTDAQRADVLSVRLLVDDLAVFDARKLSPRERLIERARAAQEAVTRHGGNRSKAARDIGISRTQVYAYEKMVRDGTIHLNG